jgi:hypothetical protein
VDNPRYNLFAHTALAHYEHAEVSRCHLQGDIECAVQSIAVTHDIIPLFYALKFRRIHFGVTKLHIIFQLTAILAENLLYLTKILVKGYRFFQSLCYESTEFMEETEGTEG